MTAYGAFLGSFHHQIIITEFDIGVTGMHIVENGDSSIPLQREELLHKSHMVMK
jgi:hypothetical protein